VFAILSLSLSSCSITFSIVVVCIKAEAKEGSDKATDSSDSRVAGRVTGDSSDPNNRKASTNSSTGSSGPSDGENTSGQGRESSNESAAGKKKGGTYPNPTTFAEKVMHILENGIAPQAIWWVDNGKSIALHPEKSKSSGMLAKYFQGNRFATFVRTLTRW